MSQQVNLISYELWNELLENHFFGTEQPNERVVFHVDADVLMEVGRGAGVDYDTADQARDDFVRAVRQELQRRKLVGDPWDPGRLRAGKIPSFFGLLAIQVLAVYDMHDDGHTHRKALWIRLAQLLDREDDQIALQNEVYAHQQKLWRRGLQAWANEVLGRRCGVIRLPTEGGGHKHVRLPKSQALLRRADLESLEDRLQYLRWSPGQPISDRSVLPSINPTDFKTAHGRRVWGDEDRRQLAARQVADFVRYDWVPGAGRRNMTLLRSQTQRAGARAWLYLDEDVPGRPCLRGGVLIPGSDGVLNAVRQVNLSKLLGRDRVLKVFDPAYSPIRRDRIVAVMDEGLGYYFVEQLWASPGDLVIVMIPAAQLERWWHGVASVAAAGEPTFWAMRQGRLPATTLQTVPDGWACIKLRIAETWPLAKEAGPWSSVIRAPLRICLSGGLKLDWNTWLAGAGPKVTIRGAEPATRLVVNGRGVAIDRSCEPTCVDFQDAGAYTLVCQFANRVAFRVVASGRLEEEFRVVPGLRCGGNWPEEGELTPGEDVPAVSGPLVLGEWVSISQGLAQPGDFLQIVQAIRWRRPLHGPSQETINPLINALVRAGKGRFDGGR